MRIFECIDSMNPLIAARDWDGLEQRYEQLCRDQAGEELTERIASLSLTRYQSALADDLSQAVCRAKRIGAKAVYFEYDMDNKWESVFFICSDYRPESEGDDDWACDYSDQVEGSALTEFGTIHREHGFSDKPAALGSACYLIARTVAVFGRAADGAPTGELPVCMGFHDQDPVVRINRAGYSKK